MKTKKFALKTLLCSTLASLSMGAVAAQTEIVLPSEVASSHWKTDYMEQFAQGVKERSNGDIKVSIYPGGQLFSDQDALAALGTGAVHMVWPVSVRLESVAPSTGTINLPFALTNDSMLNQCFYTKLTELMSSYVEDRNLQVLGFLRTADLLFVFRDRDIQKIEDLKGAKIRVTGGKVFLDMMKDLDTSPISMAASEMTTALAQGAIDGVFTSPSGWSEMIGKTGKYGWYVPGLSLSTYAVVVDRGWMQGLPESQQKAITDTIDEIAARQWTEAVEADKVSLQKMLDQGSTITTADESQQQQLREIMAQSAKAFTERYPDSVAAMKALEVECGR